MILACVAALISLSFSQQAPTSAKAGISPAPGFVPTDSKLSDMFQAKVKAEWEAIRKKDKKAYGELLADDYEGVEVDGKGERTKAQAVAEMAGSNVANYSLWGFKLIPAGEDGALVIYEVTMEFPPRAQFRYSRVYVSELWEKRKGEWKEVHYQETHVK